MLFKKSVWHAPIFKMHVSCKTFLKVQAILILAKYNIKCTKEINLLSSRRFFKPFLNDIFFQNFFVKNEKIGEFRLPQTI